MSRRVFNIFKTGIKLFIKKPITFRVEKFLILKVIDSA